MVSNVDPSLENEAKEFQEATVDQSQRSRHRARRTLRERHREGKPWLPRWPPTTSSKRSSAIGSEIDRIGALTDDLRSQIEEQRANLAALV